MVNMGFVDRITGYNNQSINQSINQYHDGWTRPAVDTKLAERMTEQ